MKPLLYIFLLFILFACTSKQSHNSYSEQVIKVMTYNLRNDNPYDKENSWNYRKEELVDLIEYYHPDFIGIQEALNNQVTYILNNASNYNYIGTARDDGDKKGEFSAVYYDTLKFKLITQKTFWLSESPQVVSVGWDASMERICTYGNFIHKQTKDTIHIFNTHFDHIGPIARTKSAELIISKINQYGLNNAKIVVMGDLNSEPQSNPIKIFNRNLKDAQKISKEKHYGPIGTFNNFDTAIHLEKRIDYVFIHNLTVKSHRHVDDKRKNNLWISDHLPVLVEIQNSTGLARSK